MKRAEIFLVSLLLLVFVISLSSSVKASECNDHIDNNEDGYCDFASEESYCADGSIVGDPSCQSDQGTESAACIHSPEVCDGIDNDCNGIVDDNIIETRMCGSNVGECRYGTETRQCSYGEFDSWGACTNSVDPAREICDGKDNDCNGIVDDNCPTQHNSVSTQVSNNTSSEQQTTSSQEIVDRTQIPIQEKIKEKDSFTLIVFLIVGFLVVIFIIVEIVIANMPKKL